MFHDAARVGQLSEVRRGWAPLPMRPLCRAMLTREYTYACGAINVVSGDFNSLILPHVNSGCRQLSVDAVGEPPPPPRTSHHHGARRCRLAARRSRCRQMCVSSRLPPYVLDRNPVEHIADELREKFFHNKAFDSLNAPEHQLLVGFFALEQDRPRVQSIVAWAWLINGLMTWKWNTVFPRGRRRRCCHGAREKSRLGRYQNEALH